MPARFRRFHFPANLSSPPIIPAAADASLRPTVEDNDQNMDVDVNIDAESDNEDTDEEEDDDEDDADRERERPTGPFTKIPATYFG